MALTGRKKIFHFDRCWPLIGLAWISLNLIVPQLPTGMPAAPDLRTRAIHPFVNYHLFSSFVDTRYGAEMRNCGKITDPAKTEFWNHLLTPEDRRVTRRRLSQLGAWFDAGDREVALRGFTRLVRQSIRAPEKCEYIMFRQKVKLARSRFGQEEISRTYLEESKIAF